MKSKKRIMALLAVLVFCVCFYIANAFDLPKVFPFDEKEALDEWQEKIFNNKVMYVVKVGEVDGHLEAKSEEACSGLLYRIQFLANQFPMMSWKWKVDQFPDKHVKAGEVTGGWMEQDDYAARVYVIFPSWNFMNIKSIEYIWDEDLPEGTVMTSPFYKNIKLIVAESGRDKIGQWVTEDRNIYEDYQKAFGRQSSVKVGAVALMTDSDNTLSTAEASYKDLRIGYRHDE